MIKLSCLLLALLVFTGSPVLTAAPLTIAEARESVGKTAEITGTVVTETMGGDNAYLSFGDAYPKQTFTVQYNRYQVAHLEEMRNTTGRQVVVVGEIASGVHGPRIIVDDIRQISILPVDETAALASPLDGGVDRKFYSMAWKQILDRGEYARIEQQAAAFHQKETRGTDGLLKSISFYEGLSSCEAADEVGWSAALEKIEAWQKASPDSITARLVEGAFLVNYAWRARGTGWSDSVSESGWKLLAERLDQAKKKLSTIPQSQRNPTYYRTMLTIALGDHWEKTKVMQLLRASQLQCPQTAEPYFQVASYLLPRWHGATGEWEKFLDKETSGDTPFQRELYARVVWAQSGYYTAPFRYSDIFKETNVKWDRVKTGFEQLLKTTPQSSWNLNYFARFAYTAGDRDTCAELAQRIAGHENMHVWLSWSNYQQILDWLGTPEKPAE